MSSVTKGFIVGNSGEYAGAEIEVGENETVVIGKNPELCNIVLMNDKLSRIHCTVKFNAEQSLFYVIDLSSNGTYFADGSRLAKNIETLIPADSNTVLYLGDKTNSFGFKVKREETVQEEAKKTADQTAVQPSAPMPVPVPTGMCCPHCGGTNVSVQAVNEVKRRGCLFVLLCLLLIGTVVGIFFLIPLLRGNKTKMVSYGVCQSCGYKWKI